MARSCDPAVLTFFGHTHQVSLEVVGLQRYVQPRMWVPSKSWSAVNIHLHGIRPPAMDDNIFPIDEEVEAMCETDGTTYCWAGHGMPARFAAHIQQDCHPELAVKIERLFCFLGCGDWVSGYRQRWTW